MILVAEVNHASARSTGFCHCAGSSKAYAIHSDLSTVVPLTRRSAEEIRVKAPVEILHERVPVNSLERIIECRVGIGVNGGTWRLRGWQRSALRSVSVDFPLPPPHAIQGKAHA